MKISYVVLRLLLFYNKVGAIFARGWGEEKVSRAITPTELMSEYKKKKIKKSSRLKSTFLLTDGVSVPCYHCFCFFFVVFKFLLLFLFSQFWNEDLGNLAQMWANKCTWDHGFLEFGELYPNPPFRGQVGMCEQIRSRLVVCK